MAIADAPRPHAFAAGIEHWVTAESQLAELWQAEFGLYPVPPLVEERMIPGKPLAWLQPALDEMAQAGAATLNEGTWRLTDGSEPS